MPQATMASSEENMGEKCVGRGRSYLGVVRGIKAPKSHLPTLRAHSWKPRVSVRRRNVSIGWLLPSLVVQQVVPGS